MSLKGLLVSLEGLLASLDGLLVSLKGLLEPLDGPSPLWSLPSTNPSEEPLELLDWPGDRRSFPGDACRPLSGEPLESLESTLEPLAPLASLGSGEAR